MEARLIHAHKFQTINSEKREWRIINPLKFGIRVDKSQILAEYKEFFNDDIAPDFSHFLTDIASEGGPWDGWNLYAVGTLRYTTELEDPTPYFQIVSVRKERTAEERDSEGLEMVGEKEGPKSEDLPVVQRDHPFVVDGRSL